MSLRDRIDQFVEERLDGYQPRKYRSPKVIHDSLWGTSRFYEHELVIIDSPLFQRLRHLNQTGLAFLAYPSLNHSRFEHSLGVATVVKRFFRKIKEKHQTGIDGLEPLNDDPAFGLLAEIRLAALLHDIGHGIFSHVSEAIYKSDTEISEILKDPEFNHVKPSELLTYLIILSNSFRKFFETYVADQVKNVNLDAIANLIVAKATPDRYFCAQIINGALDADKIDYISRDTFYSGIGTTIDVDRLFNDLTVLRIPTGQNALVITNAMALERLLFSKVLLYATIYHHQKVKAADCMFEGLIEYIQESPDVALRDCKFNDPIDFLRLSDNDVFANISVTRTDSFVEKTLSNLRNRNLFQRCLVLSRETIDNYETAVYQLNRLAQSPSALRDLRQEIVSSLPESCRCTVHEVFISLPQQPSLREASQTLVLSPLGNKLSKVKDLFPLDGWLRAFSDNKWRGHVFCPSELQSEVNKVAKKVLFDRLGITLNAKSSAYAHADVSEDVIM
jgi:HD superfamily phosphohydrolase